jgi:uncharacterized protein (TIGR02246 family)
MQTDEDSIVSEIEAFSAAWSAGDARLAASFFAEDGVRVGAMGDRQQGRAELEAAYARLFDGPFKGATVRQDRGTVRMLTPEHAVWQGGLEITPRRGPAMKGHVVQVMKKIGGRWLVIEAHPKLYPPPPR